MEPKRNAFRQEMCFQYFDYKMLCFTKYKDCLLVQFIDVLTWVVNLFV